MRYSEDAWFAGFADGEGHFGLLGRHPARAGFIPSFDLVLRADDISVLESLQAEFGGVLFRVGEEKRYCLWRTKRKSDLVKLISYFDKFPLRAKKAKDYAIWREAVLVYVENGYKDPRLVALAEAIKATRSYDVKGANNLTQN